MSFRWLLLAFAGGVAVGVVATRIAMEPPAHPVTNAVEVREPDAASPVPPAVATVVDKTPAHLPRPHSNPSTPLSSLTVPVAASPDPVPAAGVEGFVQPIDVGEVFADEIARPSQPGFENQMGDVHRALEHEMRNDGWAYAMEGELQNSMVNEVSAGEFRAEHVECRATMCEVRISGTARQTEAVKRWMENLGKHNVAQTLAMNYSTMSANGERVDMLMILRKPPSPPPLRPH